MTFNQFQTRAVGAKHNPKNRKCECWKCVGKFLKKYEAKLRVMAKIKVPKYKDQTVPIQAHFRRQPNYLRGRPRAKRVVTNVLSTFLNGVVKGMSSAR